jgi:prevent-host-death family protein
LRQDASGLLREVKAGETITITEHGRPVARLTPIGNSVIDDLIANGEIRLATKSFKDFKAPARISGLSTAEMIADSRGYDTRIY